MKIRFEYFWPGFNPKDFFLLEYFDSPEIVVDDSYSYLVISVFPNKLFPIKEDAMIIIFNGEHPSYIKDRIVRLGIKPNIQIGFIDSNTYNFKVEKLLYPFWFLYYPKFNQEFIDEIEANKNITLEGINQKKFCCLINSHDNNNTRKPIYNILSNIGRIDCPGVLLNNCDRRLCGTTSEDKIKFMNSYVFNISSENSYGPLYFTEKLPQSLNSGCIPIYHGDLSDINEKIFNKDRMIIVNDLSPNTLLQLKKKIKKLYDNKCDLLKFYRKPIFNPGAIDEYTRFVEEFKNKFKSLL
jgi:hypothetical protein